VPIRLARDVGWREALNKERKQGGMEAWRNGINSLSKRMIAVPRRKQAGDPGKGQVIVILEHAPLRKDRVHTIVSRHSRHTDPVHTREHTLPGLSHRNCIPEQGKTSRVVGGIMRFFYKSNLGDIRVQEPSMSPPVFDKPECLPSTDRRVS
jgi:hypothetical protein